MTKISSEEWILRRAEIKLITRMYIIYILVRGTGVGRLSMFGVDVKPLPSATNYIYSIYYIYFSNANRFGPTNKTFFKAIIRALQQYQHHLSSCERVVKVTCGEISSPPLQN